MEAEQIIGMFGIVLGSNALTILAVYAMAQVAKAERESRETGEKVSVPPFIYLSIIAPAGLAVACLYWIS